MFLKMFTRKSDYGLRAMVCLAKAEGATLRLTDIADTAKIPRAFLSKILQQLVQHDLVTSLKGPTGGFRLNKPAAELTLALLIEVIDGPVNVPNCFGDDESCGMFGTCRISGVLDEINRKVSGVLAKYTLADLCHEPVKSSP